MRPSALAVLACLAIPIAAAADDGVAPIDESESIAPIDPVDPNDPNDPVDPIVEAPPSSVQPVAPVETTVERCGWRGNRRMKGRLALGFSKGHLELDDDREAKQKSLLARVALRRGWEIELEFAKLELDGDDTRTAGGSLLRAFGKRKLRPYVIAGAGGGRIERADGGESHLRYAEVGGGLMLRKRRLAIGVDVRRGVRHVEADGDSASDATPRMTETPSDDGDRERYVRGRILALVYF